MKNYFVELFQYNDWANEQIQKALKGLEVIPPKCLSLLSHIVASQDIWLERITGQHDWKIEVWENYTIQECNILLTQSSLQWLKLIRKMKEKDFDELIQYKNSKGNSYESPLRHILSHVVNHSTYHRAQINMILREKNYNPVSTDFIFYSRI